MKLLNGEIFGAREPLSKLTSKDFDVSVSIALQKLILKLADPIKLVVEVQQSLIRKHGKEALKGNGRLEVITPDDPEGRPVSKSYPKFVEEFNELMSREVEIDIEIVKVPIKTDGKALQMSVNDLTLLEKFIKVE